MANQPELGQPVRKLDRLDKLGAEAIAVEALGFLAADEERLQRFLDLSGLLPSEIRAAATESGFLAGVLDHLAADEELLLAFANAAEKRPELIMAARHVLSPADFEG